MYVGMVCLYGYLSLVNYVEREREARERGARERPERFARDLRERGEVKPAAVNHLLILEQYMAVYSR